MAIDVAQELETLKARIAELEAGREEPQTPQYPAEDTYFALTSAPDRIWGTRRQEWIGDKDEEFQHWADFHGGEPGYVESWEALKLAFDKIGLGDLLPKE